MPRAVDIARIEARAAGLTRYISAKPCPQGHVGERFVASTRCCACAGVKSAARVKRKPTQQAVAAMRKADDAKVTPTRKVLARAIAGYGKSVEARDRSEYLDKLIRKIA
jgi:hypothetical protein